MTPTPSEPSTLPRFPGGVLTSNETERRIAEFREQTGVWMPLFLMKTSDDETYSVSQFVQDLISYADAHKHCRGGDTSAATAIAGDDAEGAAWGYPGDDEPLTLDELHRIQRAVLRRLAGYTVLGLSSSLVPHEDQKFSAAFGLLTYVGKVLDRGHI